MHIEDSHLGSFNVVLLNLPPLSQDFVSKRWIIVTVGRLLTQVIQLHYRAPRAVICPYIFYHENLFITTEFLETHRVPHRIFDQKPGDIVYLLPGTYHSVINLTPNLTEAINYGDARWNNFAHLLTECSCPDIYYTVSSPNPDIHNTLITRRLPVYPCQIDGCEFASRDIPSFASHMNTSHDQSLPDVPEGYKYRFVCDKAFNASNMARHVSSGPHREKKAALLSTYRSKPAYGLKQCEYCLTYVIEVEYSDHLNHCSREPHSCPVCTMTFVWLDNLAKHMARAHPEIPYVPPTGQSRRMPAL
ncbi:hypothetical protein QAD02_002803 [Eretmocerus hayati]|uniref:Uncharacterized protein n=1 Tax=Eretmocerus hayati TaxID=131215 RepID=A0ACC2NJW0_9HYME|nr:hypothetical protein QAD02_002803 [Eretmocerus hayati]